ncbi:MAG: F0F1 ATP synthase subunit A [Rhodospirillales bacterium]|nr:F0F1 ATP synthase subunit A [Alphaproteobacteria bacterium]MCB9980979.1 F0F1 ATP synthase subunit A [Rhodospirillales bacterium]
MALDPIHQFQITSLVDFSAAGFNLSFTNSALWMVIGAVASSLFLITAMRKQALVPDRLQAFSEMLYEFVAGMVRDNVGSHGRQYFPLIFTLFIVVLMGNLLGLLPSIPYVIHTFTYTSHIIVTGALALMIFLFVTVFGFYNHGLKFLTLFTPPGVPFVMQLLIVPIEVLSFLIRPATLSLRLFANMMAGHLMLKVFAGFSTMMLGLGGIGLIAGLIPMFFNVALYSLELLVAVLQAYIFAILSCIYLKDTVDLHH